MIRVFFGDVEIHPNEGGPVPVATIQEIIDIEYEEIKEGD